jgi:DNA-binding response OmpR family regulator
MTISIPISEGAARARSILIVEDEAMIAMMLEEYLLALGHHVAGIAACIAEAEALIDGGRVELAVLDCNLGGEEIWPVADRLTGQGIPIILSSGGSVSTLPER